MRIFVTGASGGLGRHLVPALLDRGHDLTLLQRPGSPSPERRGRVVEGDLLSPHSYGHCLRSMDAVLHMAAVTHTNRVGEYYRINRDGTEALLRAAGRADVERFVFVSTRAVGSTGGAYSDSKAQAEKAVRESPLPWLILRPAEVYGTGTEMIDRLMWMTERTPIILVPGDGSYRLAPIHVDDLTEAMCRLIAKSPPVTGTFTLAGPEDLSFDDCIERIRKAKGVSRLRLHVPLAALRGAASVMAALRLRRPPLVKDQIPRLLLHKDSDITLSRRTIRFEPRSIDQFLCDSDDLGRG